MTAIATALLFRMTDEQLDDIGLSHRYVERKNGKAVLALRRHFGRTF